MASKKISELASATIPLGSSDLVEVVQGGVNKKAPKSAFGLQSVQAGTNVTIDDTDPSNPIINSSGGGGSGTVESVTGDGVDNTNPANPVINSASETAQGTAELANQTETNTGTDDARIVTPLKLNTKLRATRTVTGADSLVQSDDNSLIIFNSATAFNFTLDQLTAGSKVQFMNINTGVVTFVNGSGVTVSPTSPTLMGAGSGVFPGAFVFYTSATTPILSSAYPESWLAYTPTISGFSVDPTSVVARYTLIGKTCTVRVHMVPGTSNSTGMSMTLPFTAQSRNSYSIIIQSNGITGAGRCDTTGASNVLTIYATPAGGNFANSGNKGAFFVITYEIE